MQAPTAGPASRPARTDERLAGARLPVAVALLALLAGIMAWRPAPVGIWHDDGVYALLARALAGGHGYHLVGVPGAPPSARFPPLYPALLAPLWWMAPSVNAFTRLAVGLNLLLLAGAAGGFAAYLRSRLGLRAELAALAGVAGWLHLQLWYTAFVTLSEPLFMLLLVLVLAELARIEQLPRPDRPLRLLAQFRELGPLIVLLLLLVHTRSAGVPFAIGAIAALAIRRGIVSAGIVAVGTALGMLPWLIWAQHATRAVPVPLRDMLGGYSGWVMARFGEGLGAWLPLALRHLAAALTRAVFPGSPAPLLPFLTPLALAAIIAGAWLLGRRSPGAALGLVAYLGAVVLWPFRDLRLVAPAVPLVLLGVVLAGTNLVRVARGRPLAHAGALAVAAVWICAYAIGAGSRLLDPASTRMQAVRTQQLEAAVSAVTAVTESAGVIGAPELWPAIPLHTGRLGAPSAPFRPGRPDQPAWGRPEDQYRIWAAAGIEYVLTEEGRLVHGEALDRLDTACPGALAVVSMWQDQALVHLGWDANCRARLVGEARQQ